VLCHMYVIGVWRARSSILVHTPHNTRSLATDFWVPYLIGLDSYRVRMVVGHAL
jgi:hypothetical protein